MFILENVKGIQTIDGGRTHRKILQSLRAIKGPDKKQAYRIAYSILNTKEHGIPHSRPRWYCVGIRQDVSSNNQFVFPDPIPCQPLNLFLDEKCNSSIPVSSTHSSTVLQNLHKARQSIIASGGRPEHEPWVVDCDSSLRYSNYMHNVSPCLTKSRARGHWLLHKNRRMNINEMLRLQGFNPAQVAVAVSESTLGQQIGNAMSVNVIERILTKILTP